MFFLSNRTCRTGLSRFGKLTFPKSADSQFLKTADCDYSEICRNKVTAYTQAIAQRAHEGGLKEAEIKSLLNQYCIAYSVVPKLEKTPIDAASMDMGDYPAIITTHRHNDMSRLIFNVLHELGHIEKHMYGEEKEVFVSGEPYATDSPKELEANEFAQSMLISQKLWDSMMNSGPVNGLRFGNIVSKLRDLSKEHNLDFNLVVWRWKYESHIYKLKGAKPVPIQ